LRDSSQALVREDGVDDSVTVIALVPALTAMADLAKILPKNLHELRDATLEKQSAYEYIIARKQRKPFSKKRDAPSLY
jgi:hypothetical protein